MSFTRKLLFPVMLCLIGLALWGYHSGWFVRAAYQALIAQQSEHAKSLGLDRYRVSVDGAKIGGVAANASGLTYHPESNTLFAVINSPPQIIELSTEGTLLRTLAVVGISDLEGIGHVRGNQFFIADEATQQLIHIELDERQTAIDTHGRPRIGLALERPGNVGFEGVSWDHTGHRLFVVKEKQPLRLLEVSGLLALIDAQRIDLQIREWIPKGSSSLLMRDLSSLTYHEESGNMLILSDESRLIVELDAARKPSGMLVLREGWHGLKRDVPQAEGITVGPRGEIYVLSEPNLFYRFEPPAGVAGHPRPN